MEHSICAEAIAPASGGRRVISTFRLASRKEASPKQQAFDERRGNIERGKISGIATHNHNQIVPWGEPRMVGANRFTAEPLDAVALVRLADPLAGDKCVAVLERFEAVRQHPNHDRSLGVRLAARANLPYLEIIAQPQFPGNQRKGRQAPGVRS